MNKPMLLSRVQLMSHAFASDEATRPMLQGIHVNADGSTVATDGTVLVHVKRRSPPNAADYPAPYPEWVPPAVPAEGFTIPAATAQAALKGMPKVRQGCFPLLRENVLLESLNGTLTLSATDLDNRPTFTARPVEGSFPNWEQVVPKGSAGDVSISFDAKRAAEFFSTLAKMLAEDGRKFQPIVTLSVPANGMSAVKATAHGDNHAFTALLMPCRWQKS